MEREDEGETIYFERQGRQKEDRDEDGVRKTEDWRLKAEDRNVLPAVW